MDIYHVVLFVKLLKHSISDLYLVDCIWGNYSPWSACTETCGSGKQYRFRAIERYESNGGTSCDEDQNVDEQNCNTDPCPTLGNCYFYYDLHCLIVPNVFDFFTVI